MVHVYNIGRNARSVNLVKIAKNSNEVVIFTLRNITDLNSFQLSDASIKFKTKGLRDVADSQCESFTFLLLKSNRVTGTQSTSWFFPESPIKLSLTCHKYKGFFEMSATAKLVEIELCLGHFCLIRKIITVDRHKMTHGFL